MSFNLKIIAAVLTAASFSPVFAATPSPNDAASQMVKNLANGHIKIVKSFASRGPLEGFVIQNTQSATPQQTIIYVDKDGQYMLPGLVVSSEGYNMGLNDYAKEITAVRAPKIAAQAAKMNWVEEGNPKAPHKTYAIVEANCIACHAMYGQMEPMIQSGQLAVRWIFVAFMKPQSAGMAAAIMKSKNPGQAFAKDEKGFNVQTETGAIAPAQVSPSMQAKLDANLSFMKQSGFIGTPAIIYKNNQGVAQLIHGVPQGNKFVAMVDDMSKTF